MMETEVINLYFQCLSRTTAVEIVNSSKVLQAETSMLLDGKLLVQLSNFIHLFSLLFPLFPNPLFSLLAVCLFWSLGVSHFNFCRLFIVFVQFLFYSFICPVHNRPMCRRANRMTAPVQTVMHATILGKFIFLSVLFLSAALKKIKIILSFETSLIGLNFHWFHLEQFSDTEWTSLNLLATREMILNETVMIRHR